eukprot:scaffold96912_cov61-Cyclotella_meneghiniana.AAC.1
MLPTFGDDDNPIPYFEFIAQRMRNYMIYIKITKGFKPRYYSPNTGHTIQAGHLARFYGCHLARMIRGFPSIEATWSTRESLDAIGAAKESMPKDAYIDMYRCMHFSDDWDDDWDMDGETSWEEIFADPKYEPSPDVERHRRKYEHIEDGFNCRWKEVVSFGRWITADESRVAGWYKSTITIGPEPKPIRTGATIHSMCVTHGPLATFKLQCRVYGGKADEGLDYVNKHTANTQKWVNLYDEMFEEFKDNGMCCTLDSAYMGDILGQVAREEWKMNLVGTCQSDRTGAGPQAKEAKAAMKVGNYESVMFQHKALPLTYALWSDNSIVKTLSNFHTPEVLEAGSGVARRRRVDGQREMERTEVQCPLQQKDYSETFHLIDKGNGKESKYDLGGQTKGHNWAPKLHMRYFNFGLGNTDTMYQALCQEHTPNRRIMDMPEGVRMLAHFLMQYGEPMRRLSPEHPAHSRDLTNVWDFGTGRKVRTDAKGFIAKVAMNGASAVPAPNQRARELREKQKKSKWRVHQSCGGEKKGRCSWDGCDGLKSAGAKRKRTAETYMYCEECSAAAGKTIYLCNVGKKDSKSVCHMAYHQKYHNKKYAAWSF